MLYQLLFILFFSFLVSGCEKPNPNPESLDPIYEDLLKEASASHSAFVSAQKDVQEHQKELEAAVPQSGQNKYAVKRIEEAQSRVTHFEQMELYYQLAARSRMKADQISYLKAFKEKKPWPPSEEWESYEAQKRLQQTSKQWNVKARMEEAKREYGVDMSFKSTGKLPSGEAAKPKEEKEGKKEE